MQAILRRKHGLKNNTIQIHEYIMDIQNRTVLHGKDAINLTKKEFDILHYMALHKNRVLTRVQLTEHIWGDVMEEDYESNYIDVHIKNIRKKMGTHGNAEFIETVRGIGYRLNMQ
jgi:DNA-binding response OmpR family regulator